MAAPIDLSTLSSLEEQIYVAALQLQNAELAIPEDDRPDNATVEFSAEDGNVSLSITLSTDTSIENGKAVISAKPYL
jgi:hypothetical protein